MEPKDLCQGSLRVSFFQRAEQTRESTSVRRATASTTVKRAMNDGAARRSNRSLRTISVDRHRILQLREHAAAADSPCKHYIIILSAARPATRACRQRRRYGLLHIGRNARSTMPAVNVHLSAWRYTDRSRLLWRRLAPALGKCVLIMKTALAELRCSVEPKHWRLDRPLAPGIGGATRETCGRAAVPGDCRSVDRMASVERCSRREKRPS